MAATAILIPQINSNDLECLVDRIYIESGKMVQEGELLFSMQTSKATVDVEAEFSGIFVSAMQAPGKLQVGQTLGWIGDSLREVTELSAKSPMIITKDHAIKESTLKALSLQQADTAKQAEIQNLVSSQEVLFSSLTVKILGQRLLQKAENQNWPVVTLSPLILVELYKLLLKNPLFLSYAEGSKLYFRDEVKIGIAVDTGQGLRIYSLSLSEDSTPEGVQNKIIEILLKEKSKKWTAKDFQPVNFIVTDLSGYEVLQFQPVLSQHQGSCLAIGADKSLAGQPHTLTLAFDHRVLSGREVALFLSELKNNILKY